MEISCDVVVVGGGHAGAEAAAAAARLGARAVLVTPDLCRIAQMSCNPAIGGVAKGTVVREIGALGGVMARAADATRIHFRMLNRSKGPAVWGPRAQCDRSLYSIEARRVLEEIPGLDLFQGMVVGLIMEGKRVRGVATRSGARVLGRAVVVTTGTFLRGRIHMGGASSVAAGRAGGEEPSIDLASELEKTGLTVDRFKTGTPPRVDGRTVNLDACVQQPGEEGPYWFDPYMREAHPRQKSCWMTWTNKDTARVIASNLSRSALYGGRISARGPRYCPSIEDKVVRFPDRDRHQVFLEPEGLSTSELYVNGLSTSLPPEAQLEFLRTVPGLEDCRITRPGYAIEYDYFPPHQLRHSLEVRGFSGLYFAGQVNGTTGYEEAGGQGLIAGANAALSAQGREPLLLERDQAFLGVMIDDLVTKGVDEPYRLFTSRAEFRLLLRQDNAASRLGPIARKLGLLTPQQEDRLAARERREQRVRAWVRGTTIPPAVANRAISERESPISKPARAAALLKRPLMRAEPLVEAAGAAGIAVEGVSGASDALAAIETEIKYEGYIHREREQAKALRRKAGFKVPEDAPYPAFHTLSREARDQLERVRPANIAQAARIPGVSPADLQNLVMEIRRLQADGGVERST